MVLYIYIVMKIFGFVVCDWCTVRKYMFCVYMYVCLYVHLSFEVYFKFSKPLGLFKAIFRLFLNPLQLRT